MPEGELVGSLLFGENRISADKTGIFTLTFVHGGVWNFDLGEIRKLDEILAEIEKSHPYHERTFWRTNGSKVIQVQFRDGNQPFNWIFFVEGGTKEARFFFSEITQLRKGIQILTSEGAPYGRSVLLMDAVEEGRVEELVTQQQIPLDNRNSSSPLVVEREFSRETKKIITTEKSFGVGLDYYIVVSLELRYGVTQEESISERIMVRMEAAPGENKVYTITWKEIWITGYGVFDMGNGNHNQRIPFRLKSGLQPNISQEIIR